MDSQKQSAIDRIKQANNILVTVSANPTVDQLAACLGLTLMLDKLEKHATAVFSGSVPSTIDFLQPEKTLEKNTDSLRDFIIALDKSKADKLRYKVEDKVVKIFITPYRTSISEHDLEFSQGDFNVDVVVALGVHDQKELDQAITAHGRILHDATVISINTAPGNNIGTINWQDQKASSLSEMVTSMVDSFDKKILDNQVATALLTGVVAETDRFSNAKTTPDTMKASAQLMGAGANQQLVATKLEEPPPPPPPPPTEEGGGEAPPESGSEPPKSNDGTLRIDHNVDELEEPKEEKPEERQPPEPPKASVPEPPKEPDEQNPQIHIDDQGRLHQLNEDREFLAGPGPEDDSGMLPSLDEEDRPSGLPKNNSEFAFTPPSMGGTLTANSQPERLDPSTDPFSSKSAAPLLEHNGHHSAAAPPTQGVVTPSLPANGDKPAQAPPPAPPSDNGPANSSPSATTIPDFALPEPTVTPSTDAAGSISPLSAPIISPGPTGLSDAQSPATPPAEPSEANNDDGQTLSDIEQSVHSPHLKQPDTGDARAAVEQAVQNGPGAVPEPIAALNATPLGSNLHDNGSDDSVKQEPTPAGNKLAEPLTEDDTKDHDGAVSSSPEKPLDMPLPSTPTPLPSDTTPTPSSDTGDSSAPPPVPPPFMPTPPSGQ
jgi:hypothetical protein